jgi:hypothetical protein
MCLNLVEKRNDKEPKKVELVTYRAADFHMAEPCGADPCRYCSSYEEILQ